MGFGNQVDVLVAKPIKQFHVCVVLNTDFVFEGDQKYQTVPKGCVLFGLSVTEGHGYGRVRWGTFPLTFSPQNRCQIRVPF